MIGDLMVPPLYPVGDRVFISLDAVGERKVGLIYTAEANHLPTRFGTILRVGDEVTKYKPGDRVFLSYHAGLVVDRVEFNTRYNYKADQLRIVTEGEVQGFVREEKEEDDGDVGL